MHLKVLQSTHTNNEPNTLHSSEVSSCGSCVITSTLFSYSLQYMCSTKNIVALHCIEIQQTTAADTALHSVRRRWWSTLPRISFTMYSFFVCCVFKTKISQLNFALGWTPSEEKPAWRFFRDCSRCFVAPHHRPNIYQDRRCTLYRKSFFLIFMFF